MVNGSESLSGVEMSVPRSFERQTDADLVFYRVAKVAGYPVSIVDICEEDGQIRETNVTMPTSIAEELVELWGSIQNKTKIIPILSFFCEYP